jgi:hypothetical protein
MGNNARKSKDERNIREGEILRSLRVPVVVLISTLVWVVKSQK